MDEEEIEDWIEAIGDAVGPMTFDSDTESYSFYRLWLEDLAINR